MELVLMTVGAWVAFAVAAIVPGFLFGQVVRACPKAHA